MSLSRTWRDLEERTSACYRIWPRYEDHGWPPVMNLRRGRAGWSGSTVQNIPAVPLVGDGHQQSRRPGRIGQSHLLCAGPGHRASSAGRILRHLRLESSRRGLLNRDQGQGRQAAALPAPIPAASTEAPSARAVQLHRNPEQRHTWPRYETTARPAHMASHGCDTGDCPADDAETRSPERRSNTVPLRVGCSVMSVTHSWFGLSRRKPWLTMPVNVIRPLVRLPRERAGQAGQRSSKLPCFTAG